MSPHNLYCPLESGRTRRLATALKRPTHVTICRSTDRTTRLSDCRFNRRSAVLPPHVRVKSFRFY
jgi:hypothetical protein